jgi:hypothetical protein
VVWTTLRHHVLADQSVTEPGLGAQTPHGADPLLRSLLAQHLLAIHDQIRALAVFVRSEALGGPRGRNEFEANAGQGGTSPLTFDETFGGQHTAIEPSQQCSYPVVGDARKPAVNDMISLEPLYYRNTGLLLNRACTCDSGLNQAE